VYWDRAKPSSRGHCIGPWFSNEGHPRSSVHCASTKSMSCVRAVYKPIVAKGHLPPCAPFARGQSAFATIGLYTVRTVSGLYVYAQCTGFYSAQSVTPCAVA